MSSIEQDISQVRNAVYGREVREAIADALEQVAGASTHDQRIATLEAHFPETGKFVVGSGTAANGDCSHAEGTGTQANSRNSHAEGLDTVAYGKSQHVFGEFNVQDGGVDTENARATFVEIVGNGNGNEARSNARTLDWQGNEALAGDLTVNKGTASEMTVGAEVSSLKGAIFQNADLLAGSYTVKNQFVQGNYNSSDSMIANPPSIKRICETIGYLPAGTSFDVVPNGLYMLLQVFALPVQTPNNTLLESYTWAGGSTPYKIILAHSGYIGINIANGINSSTSTEIVPSDYAMEIVVTAKAVQTIERIDETFDSLALEYKVISDGKLLNNQSYGYRDSTLANSYRTPIIPCTPGTVFEYFGRCDYNYAAVYFKDANGVNIKREQTGNAVGTYTFTAPENAYFAEFSSYGTEHFMVSVPAEKSIGNLSKAVAEMSSRSNPLSGKSILFVGDSITEGVGYNGGWVTLVQNRNNCSCTNQGHGGWTIGKTPGSSNNLLRLLQGMADGYDYIILSGGYNDFTTSPRAEIGELTPYTYSPLTAETFAGDLEAYLRTARTKWLTAKIGFILTMKKEFNDTTVNARQVQYWDIIRNACKKYSIPLLDLYNESGLVGVVVDGVTDAVTQKYYNANIAFPNGDGTHPNNDGYAYLIHRVENFIKGL